MVAKSETWLKQLSTAQHEQDTVFESHSVLHIENFDYYPNLMQIFIMVSLQKYNTFAGWHMALNMVVEQI